VDRFSEDKPEEPQRSSHVTEGDHLLHLIIGLLAWKQNLCMIRKTFDQFGRPNCPSPFNSRLMSFPLPMDKKRAELCGITLRISLAFLFFHCCSTNAMTAMISFVDAQQTFLEHLLLS
jgi:hypothetical protein